MYMILCEGNIGNGKSTLTRQLSELMGARPFFEPVETNPYLELYYKDPKTYALSMQFYLMSHRYAMHLEGVKHVWSKQETAIFDRSIYGDFVFAKRNWLDGNMSTLDFDNYNKMREVMFKSLMVPHVTIFLKCSPETSYKRILSRGRDCEKTIPLSYLKGINDLYSEVVYDLKNRGSKILELDWEEFKSVEYVYGEVKKVLGLK